MPRNNPGRLVLAALAGWLFAGGPALAADDEALGFERTPPRLAFLDGEVSFLRPGAPDWVPAEVNTPLAPGDALYVPADSNLEIQIGARAFVRAGEETELALTSLEPDYLQLRVTAGQVSLDLRALEAAQTFEIDTPNAAFTIENSGYYRVEVDDDTTTFITRRGGRASVTLALGAPATLAASEQVVITGIDAPQIETYAAPELDAWDRWNYARTDRQLEAVSARYVPAGVYGVYDLDQYGAWRVVPSYGALWVPQRVPVGWAPYTTGRWIYDSFFGWTWVDTAPWGWAPYHYGRWVHVSGYWAWAPGPIVARPYYAPALVAFYGGGPSVGWVALGWGEPLFPWWGPRDFRSRARWRGWGGPHVVNQVVIKKKTVIHVHDVHAYENARVRHAFVAVDREHFGRRSEKKARIHSARAENFKPLAGDLELRPSRESLTPSNEVGRRPPREKNDRPIVATREPRIPAVPELESQPRKKRGGEAADRPADPARAEHRVRIVESPHTRTRDLQRPPFGSHGDEERAAPPPPPRYERSPAREVTNKQARPERVREASQTSPTPPPAPRAKQEKGDRPERGRAPREKHAAPASKASERQPAALAAEPELPGVPANRVYRGHAEQVRPRGEKPPAAERAPDPTRGEDEHHGRERGR